MFYNMIKKKLLWQMFCVKETRTVAWNDNEARNPDL
jgi:hypothetical protein